MTQLNCVYERVQEYISLDNWDANDAPKGWPGHVAIVDGTEVFINCWQKNCFSKKKGHQTLKYQVVINASTYQVLHVLGPYKGSRHDSVLFHNSIIPEWLSNNNIRLLGDKGYIGCDRITTPIKKQPGQKQLKPSQKLFNKKVSQVRICIENHCKNQTMENFK